MKSLIPGFLLLVSLFLWSNLLEAAGRPYSDGQFKGRIAYSADGNHNDPDDWAASPIALAIIAEAGLKDRLVHFDYNCILPVTDAAMEKEHAESVLGAVARYGFDKAFFFDCRKDLPGALHSLTAAINESSADNPLYLIVAGPVEVPYRAIEKSEREKRKFVFCISHSRWNDGFASNYKFTFTKRSVIEQDVQWIQIRDQNQLLSLSPYKRPARPEEFKDFFWMRDSADSKLQFLWQRTLASTRPDPSDAGMAYFVVSGDEECDARKLNTLLANRRDFHPVQSRKHVRLEAENFRFLEGFGLDDRKDKSASHQLCVKLAGAAGSVRTKWNEIFTSDTDRYDIVIRHGEETGASCRYAFYLNGVVKGAWESTQLSGKWTSHGIPGVMLSTGDELRVEAKGPGARLDYVQLDATSGGNATP